MCVDFLIDWSSLPWLKSPATYDLVCIGSRCFPSFCANLSLFPGLCLLTSTMNRFYEFWAELIKWNKTFVLRSDHKATDEWINVAHLQCKVHLFPEEQRCGNQTVNNQEPIQHVAGDRRSYPGLCRRKRNSQVILTAIRF